jgi:hypothetical protein
MKKKYRVCLIFTVVLFAVPALSIAADPAAPRSLTEWLAMGQPERSVQPVAVPVATAQPQALFYYTDRAEFDADYPGLPIEGYENGSMPFGSIADIPHPLDASSSNTYFDPGDILPGIQFWATDNHSADEIAVLGEQFDGNPSKTAVANHFDDSYHIVFDPPVMAAGMDLQSYMGSGSCQVDIYDTNGFLASDVSDCNAAGVFWGVASDADPIVEIVITDSGIGAEGADNIAYGIWESPCELIVKHKRIRSEKLTKPRRIALRISSEDEFFDIFGLIDIEPLAWDKVKFNQKKNRMIIRAIVPFMLAPGVYPISAGDCFGEFVVE